MCLAIPGKIISIESKINDISRLAKVSFDGVLKEASLELVPEAKVGDFVLIHVGIAISLVDEDEAMKTLDYLRQIGELNELNEQD